MEKNKLLFVGILLISILFRFYRNDFLQFWSDDEALHAAVVQRMLMTKRPTLVSPQPTLGTSIGAGFHLLSVPLFLISKSNLTTVLTIFSLVGLITAYLIFLLGKEVKNRSTGLTATFLYSASFFASLYDRRWWPITLTPLLATLALLLAIRMFKSGKTHYLPYLIAITASALHGDPAMIMIGLFTLVSLISFRIVPAKIHLAISAVVILIAVSPLLIFEIRHPGTIVAPFLQTISRQKSIGINGLDTVIHSAKIVLDTLNLLFFPAATQAAETFLYPQQTHFNALTLITIPLVLFLIFFPLVKAGPVKDHPTFISLKAIYIYITNFIIGSLTFGLIYRHQLQRVYLTLLFPAVFVLVGYSLMILNKLNRFVIPGFLLLFLAINSFTLAASRFRFPLSTRQQAVNSAIDQLETNSFSLYAIGDPYLESGGFSRLFALAGKPPTKSSDDAWLGWYFRTHGLYTTTPSLEDQKLIVVISPSSEPTLFPKNILSERIFDSLKLTILNNSTDWFSPDQLRHAP